MKTTIFFRKSLMTIVFIFASMILSLQGFTQRVQFGISFGSNVSWWSGEMDNFTSDFEQDMIASGLDATFHEKPRLGINLGMSFIYKPVKWFSIQPELNYINKGTHLTGTCNVDGVDVDMRLAFNVNYINIPVAFKFITPSGFYVSMGPYADILTHAKMKITASAMGDSESDKEKLPNVSRFNYGVMGGIGYQEKEVGVELRYLHGGKSVFTEGISSYNMRNSVIEVKLDFYFGKQSRNR